MKANNSLATWNGLALSILTALVVIDWDNFQLNPKTVFTILLLSAQAISGYYSSFNPKKDNSKPPFPGRKA